MSNVIVLAKRRAWAELKKFFARGGVVSLPCKTCCGLRRVGGYRYAATGTLTDTRPCPDCAVAN